MRRSIANALFKLLAILIVVGLLLWLVNRLVPMQEPIKFILNVVVVIAVVLGLLNISGLFIRSPASMLEPNNRA